MNSPCTEPARSTKPPFFVRADHPEEAYFRVVLYEDGGEGKISSHTFHTQSGVVTVKDNTGSKTFPCNPLIHAQFVRIYRIALTPEIV